MNRKEYKRCRQLIRENGYSALRWLNVKQANIMKRLRDQPQDKLAEKAWAKIRNSFEDSFFERG